MPAPAPAATKLPINDRMTVASLIGANSPLALEAVEDAQAVQTPAAKAAAAQADNAAQPAAATNQVAEAAPAADDAAPDEGDTGGNDESVDATPPDAHTGWRIQIAAAPTQAGAEDMLDRALAKGGKVLTHVSPYTEPSKNGAGTIYRARFAGFSSKEKARAACAYLVRHKFSCLAVGNN